LGVRETSLLIDCIRSQLNKSRTRDDGIAKSTTVDWFRLVETARAHGVTPILYRGTSNHKGPKPPPETAEKLKAHALGTRLRNIAMAREAVRIAELLKRDGIAALVFKGPVLAQTVYGDVGMREFSDLDFLVHESEVEGVNEALRADGYRPRAMSLASAPTIIRRSCEDWFEKPGSPNAIDLHWRMTPRFFPFSPGVEAVRDRAIAIEFERGCVRTLSPSDTITFICVHAAKHGWVTLREVTDLAFALRKFGSEIDWDELFGAAKSLGAASMIALGLILARGLLGVDVRPFLRIAPRSSLEELASRIEKRILSGKVGRSFFDEWGVPLVAIDGNGRRFRYAAQRVISPTIDDWEFVPLPERLFPLYYMLRPARLTLSAPRSFRTPKQPWKRLRRTRE